jgi:hypothetical protein
MATEAPKRWIDEQSNRELDRDTAAAYAEVTKSLEGKSGPVGALQKIGRVLLKWDNRPRNKTHARAALKQLIGVPADQNSNWYFESALRDAMRSCLDEEAEAETDR